MKKALKRHGCSDAITTGGLDSYKAAMKVLGNVDKQENRHLPFRRRERAMLRLRQMKSPQKFASVHPNVHYHFSFERHIVYS